MSSSSGATDFIARFPDNYSIQSDETLILGLHDSQTFTDYYGYAPDMGAHEYNPLNIQEKYIENINHIRSLILLTFLSFFSLLLRDYVSQVLYAIF